MQHENSVVRDCYSPNFPARDFGKLLVQNILQHPQQFDWSVQGLGMLRVYLSRAVRLHIWDGQVRIPGVSAMHTHPWHLESHVIAGVYKQHRYLPRRVGYSDEEFNEVKIKCGENACVIGDASKVWLREDDLEIYRAGDRYEQKAEEIHLSLPEDGTVTIVERKFLKDTEHASVYWRGTGKWVDAAPRHAKPDEVLDITRRSLERWFV